MNLGGKIVLSGTAALVASGVAAAEAGAGSRDGVCESGEVCGFRDTGFNNAFVFDVAGQDTNYAGDEYIGWWNVSANDNHSSLSNRRNGTYRFCKNADGSDCFQLAVNQGDQFLDNDTGNVPPGYNDELSYHKRV